MVVGGGGKGGEVGYGLGLVVRDKYFQKVLRVVPAGEGMRGGRRGLRFGCRGWGRGGGIEVWLW